MHKLFEWIKKHPWETGLIIFGIGALYVLYAHSGASSSSTSSTGMTAQDYQLAAATLQAQTQLAGANISAGVQENATAAGVTVAGLQATTQQNADTLSAQTAQDIAQLQAGVANNSTNANLQASLAQTSALEAIALAPYQVEEDQLNSTTNAAITQLETQLHSVNEALAGFYGNPANSNSGYAADYNAAITALGNVRTAAQPATGA